MLCDYMRCWECRPAALACRLQHLLRDCNRALPGATAKSPCSRCIKVC
jgi:hypothetical protein